ncbi:phospholipase D-like domain-containing protein [Aurantiacibacter sp. D1-12]|uniref:phospholipase D-like domain-containing protein n=1 Tax=Aurantiacibacter sp. D1-12 TaxID=2993658 RepID=UPI00237C964E|nr:phosphatidylserine/phosphatidylglycerophosphate/cardiolipin synthase family protein [Aurantiacibacter sp. D1-12]MDE1467261.1 phosphatidylserine/phosphatidylglycerophosphate/cardiolipin synthase family protein [Aurantiacibacter sp. D1-12]
MYAEPDPCAHDFPAVFTHETQGHVFTFMPDGGQRYQALLASIEEARHRLEIFYYMFQDDEAGGPVRDAIVRAAERGVDVDLVVDRFGTDAGDDFFAPIIDAGGRFAFFNPRWNTRYLIRNHQKMCIIDDETAIVGGFNVSDHYFKPPEENGWADLGVIVQGPVVARLRDWFAQISGWAHDPNAQYRAVRSMVREWDPGDARVRLLVGGPTRIPSGWEQYIKRDFNRARRLDMVMAYFSPPLSYRRLIRKVADRGKVNLVMAAKSDNGATIGASRALYRKLLKAGARIFEFQPCKLHMKLLVVDEFTYFGSANFDHRSIRINLEMMIRVEDEELADRMRCYIAELRDASEEITPQLHRKRSNPWALFKWWLSWSLVYLLDYTVTRRLNP